MEDNTKYYAVPTDKIVKNKESDRNFMAQACTGSFLTSWSLTGWRVRAGTVAGNEYAGSIIIPVSKNMCLCFYLRTWFLFHNASSDNHVQTLFLISVHYYRKFCYVLACTRPWYSMLFRAEPRYCLPKRRHHSTIIVL